MFDYIRQFGAMKQQKYIEFKLSTLTSLRVWEYDSFNDWSLTKYATS